MNDLYSIKDVAKIFELPVSRLRYWAQTGFVGPSVRRGGRVYYTFQDLIGLRTAKELLDAGLSMQKVRKNLESLRTLLPDVAHPASRMRICSDGETVVAVDSGVAFEPATGQVVMSFEIDSLSNDVADVLALPTPTMGLVVPAEVPAGAPADASSSVSSSAPASAPASALDHLLATDASAASNDGGATEDGALATAYQCFVEACAAEDQGEDARAEQLYRLAIERQPSLAAAHTNLGNLRYRQGDLAGARAAYERALEYEPTQPEARFDLGNLFEDLGETERAINELRRVCWTNPDFADAHYNLGLMLARVGGTAQARKHLQRYLELDDGSEWAERARDFLAALKPAA